MAPRKKLGELLLEAELIDPAGLERALAHQKDRGRPLGVNLVLLDLVDEMEMLRVLARQLNVPVVRLSETRLDPDLVDLLPYETARRHQCLPLYVESEGAKQDLYVGMSNPTDLEVLDDLAFRSGMSVHPVLVGPVQLEDAIERAYRRGGFQSEAEQPGTARDFTLEDVRAAGERRDEANEEPEILHSRSVPSEPVPDEGSDKGAPASRIILRALVQLLIDRGVISRDELAQRVRQMSRSRS